MTEPSDTLPFQTIRFSLDKGLATIELMRPEVRNAFNPTMIKEIRRAAKLAAADRYCRLLVIRGNEKFFCSGADLNWMSETGLMDETANRKASESIASLYQSIQQIDLPVLTIASGAVFGGALGFLSTSDWVLATPDARFCFSEVKLGIVPAIIMPHVMRRMNRTLAMQKMMTGEVFDVAEGIRTGLVDRIVKFDQMEQEIGKLMSLLNEASPMAVREVKQLEKRISGKTPKKSRSIAIDTLSELKGSPEGKYGMKAFLKKEKPDWSL